MMGHHFGAPPHNELQRSIIIESLQHVYDAKESGEIKFLPYKWAQARREGIAINKQQK